MNYIIVKNASQEAWHLYFDSNPQAGVHQSYSVHDTFTGQRCNIRSSYATKASAEEDLKKMLEANPSGCYAVCPVVVTAETEEEIFTKNGSDYKSDLIAIREVSSENLLTPKK